MSNINILADRGITKVDGFNIGGGSLDGIMIKEIVMAESLLTPGLQTFVRLHSTIYQPPGKNFDSWKNKDMSFSLRDSLGNNLSVNQKVYRLEDRGFMPTNVGQTEQMTVHACDKSTLDDAKCLVSKSWKCTKPSEIVSHIMQKCLKATNKRVDSADPARDYIAENIHPLQVIAQQTNVALDGGQPSFLHYMTYENGGTHYFRSLKKMTQGGAAFTYKHAEVETKTGYIDPMNAINFSFPCDFDYLSDLLNGLDENGQDKNTGAFMNPVYKLFSLGGDKGGDDCGIGGFNYKEGLSNKSTAENQNSCNIDAESHLLKRQAIMGMLDRDKIALRITVPCNVALHVGNIIRLNWNNKLGGGPVYGSGDYLISSLNHNIKLGGFSVTTMDCVSKTVGGGVV